MNLFNLTQYFLIVLLGITICPILPGQESREAKGAFADLSEAEQKRIREALRKVWSDPTVLSARENVNRSAKEYHRAVREMIKKQDPETARLLEQIQQHQSGFLHTAMGGGNNKKKHIHGASVGRLSQMVAPPPMMEKMNAEQKEQFKEASAKARQRPEVIEAIEDLMVLSKEDEEIRKKKLEAFRKLRRAYFQAIVEIDPALKELIPPPGSPSFNGKGKGKGKSMNKSIEASN